jgi:hypothetical protein
MEKYNGWTNYETWRTALEFVDNDYYADADFEDCDGLADYIRDTVTEFVFNDAPDERAPQSAFESLGSSLITQFFNAVNWYEIAEHIKECAA